MPEESKPKRRDSVEIGTWMSSFREESRAFVRRSAKIKKPWTGARRPGAGDSARPVSGCLAAKTHRPLRSKTVSFLQRKCLYHVRHEKGSDRAAKNGKNPVPRPQKQIPRTKNQIPRPSAYWNLNPGIWFFFPKRPRRESHLCQLDCKEQGDKSPFHVGKTVEFPIWGRRDLTNE